MNIETCSFGPKLLARIPQKPCDKTSPQFDQKQLRIDFQNRKRDQSQHTQPVLTDKWENDTTNLLSQRFTNQWPELTILGDDVDRITTNLYAKWCQDHPEECQRGSRYTYPRPSQYPQLPIPRGDGINYNPVTQPTLLTGFGLVHANYPGLQEATFAGQVLFAIGTAGIGYAIEYVVNIAFQFIGQALGIEGRPKEAATDEISRYSHSFSPVIQILGIGGYELAIRNIPISSPDAFKIFGPYFRQAAELLLSEHLPGLDTLKKCAAFLALCLHAMGNPNDSQWPLQHLVELERKAGIIPTAAEEKAIKARRMEHNTKINREAIRHERGWEHRYNTPVARRHAVARA